MKENYKINLHFLTCRLQSIEHYPDPKKAFEILLYGWAKNQHHGTQWLSQAKKRGWLSVSMARSFAQYCLQNDWQKMMPY